MTSHRFPEFLLFLLLPQVYSEEAEPVFKEEGSIIEMGYCFGVDYIVVFRSTPEGDLLLGNSSADNTPVSPPADLRGRIRINKHEHLLGLQISHLTHMDSGIYRRECWQDHTLVSQHTQELSVCDEEVESEEIIVREHDGGAELLCNSTTIGLEGTSVRWYYEMYPSYKVTLFLDSSVSLEPLVKELQGVVEVRDSRSLLLLDNSMLKTNQHFYCLVMKDTNCLSFQNMYQPDHSESRDIFASQGDRVVLNCPSDGNNQQWETPLGIINGSSVNISFGDKSEDFSLVIPAVSDEHSGDYSCVSSSLEVQYSLVLCPIKESQEKAVFLGQDVLLDCDVDERDSQRVQWHRLDPSGEYELIHDSKDETVAIPQDLRGRLTLSENGSLLTISHLQARDLGVHWCVVLEGPRLLEGNEYIEDYGDFTGEDDNSDDQHWDDTHRCVFKQETMLSLTNETRIGEDLEPVTIKSVTNNLEMDIVAAPSAASNVTAYAVGGGLVCLLVVLAVVLAIIFIKRRAKASRLGVNTTKDIKMNEDPDCSERLTHNNENNV